MNFVDCESFLESNSPDIFALCETNLDDSIDSGNFSVRAYLPIIRKDSTTHMNGLTVSVKEVLPFARTYLKKTLQILMFSTVFTSPIVLFLFPLSITFFVFMYSFLFYFI